MARAAEELSCAVSTVARRIDGLEQTLGLTLLHRARGGATPTDAGEAIIRSIDFAAKHLDQIPRQAKNHRQFKRRRPVRISATETAINDILLPHVSRLRHACPELLVEFESTNAISSLEFGQTDLAIRLVQPEPADLIMRKLVPVKLSFFVSASQLGNRDPSSVSLQQDDLVWIDSGLGDIAENRMIDQLEIGDRIVLRATSVRALALACEAGQGVALLPNYMGREFGLIGLDHIDGSSRQPWLVYHPETRRDPIMRSVRRWVIECFGKLAN